MAKLLSVDTWVVLDNVQFVNRDYQHRVLLSFKAQQELRSRWYTLHVSRPHGRGSLINQVRVIDPNSDASRFEAVIKSYYGHSEYFAEIVALMAEASIWPFSSSLDELGVTTTRFVLDALGWGGEVIWASEFEVSEARNQRLIDLTEAVGATDYVSGSGGLRYVDRSAFGSAGIGLFGPTHSVPEAGRSSLDVLLREGLAGLTAISSAWQSSLGRH